MKLILILKEICYRLNLIADYVVEQGTTGVWIYQKWNSGWAECWTYSDISLAGAQTPTALLGGYWTYTDVVLPFEMTYSSITASANGKTGTGLGFGYAGAISSTTVRVYVLGNQNDKNMVYNAIVHGRWK